ncbi:MAG: hypothetical protein KGM96_08775 [Acidobacteriota bacterium]|nr:hypothetical protein [Acidobacteriota bacterium]
MSEQNGAFFQSEEAEKAKIVDTIRRGKALKEHLLALDNEFIDRADSWIVLIDGYKGDLGDSIFKAGEKHLDILRPYPPGYHDLPNRPRLNTVASLSRAHFDGESLWNLIADREKTKQMLTEIKRRLSDIGITI